MKPENYSRRHFLWLALAGAVAGCTAVESAVPPKATATGATANKDNGKNKMSKEPVPIKVPEGKEIATIAGGCFWCVEAIFLDLKGVEKVESGYSGGEVPNPSYEAVCSGTTGHAEAIQITFDPKVISYGDLLHIFLTTHDPTTLNRQGADVGTQYRSAIFFHSKAQEEAAHAAIKDIDKEKLYDNPIVTEVSPYTNFYAAEAYHQNYFNRNQNQGYCQLVIAPKVAKFRQKYKERLKK